MITKGEIIINRLKKAIFQGFSLELAILSLTIALLLSVFAEAADLRNVEENSQSYIQTQDIYSFQRTFIRMSDFASLAGQSYFSFNIDDEPEDRESPIYEVYKNGIPVEVSAEVQWIIRDFAQEYDFDEKIIFGLCLEESTFNTWSKSSDGKCLGLAQINHYWFYTDSIPRLEDTPQRDPHSPYDNLLTLMEMWVYARDTYSIDTSTEQGLMDLLYWHNTGKYYAGVNWEYSKRCLAFSQELIEI